MQVITVGSTAQDLCTKLASVAVPGFFDSVEMAEGSTKEVECKIGGNLAMSFNIIGTYDRLNVTLYDSSGNTTSFQYAVNYSMIGTIIVTSKSITLIEASSNIPLIIAKDTDGNVTAIYCYSSGTASITTPSSSAATNFVRAFGIRGARAFEMMYYSNNDASTKKMYCVPILAAGDTFIDGVYIGLVRPYPNEPGYMPFTIGSTEYVGFGGTTFVVKA